MKIFETPPFPRGCVRQGNQPKARGVDTAPDVEFWGIFLWNSLEKERNPTLIECFLHRASKRYGPVERCGKYSRGVITNRLIHPNCTVDYIGYPFSLGLRRTGIQENDANILP
jgi:hypothetical protein